MLILGIESSCDETAISVCDCSDNIEVKSSLISSQIAVHQRFGGVVPEVAAREHLKSIAPLTRAALKAAGVAAEDIAAVAVTQGPGLIGPLLVGTAFARGFALIRGIPLIPVDHVHAHIHGALLGQIAADKLSYPVLALVASGGHSNLYLMKSPTDYKILGYTLDDACGESFDKVAKLLGQSYPGGPKIEKLAAAGDASKVAMPRMMKQKDSLNFSYSGLKTHMVNLRQKQEKLGFSDADLCAAFQEAAIDQLIRKISLAAEQYSQARQIIVAGGVSANQVFRHRLRESVKLEPIFPELKYCSDNGAMIAAAGFWLMQAAEPESLKAVTTWEAYSRYRYELVT